MTSPSVSVLVVEDEESFIQALSVGLGREGFDVTVARDGAEGIELFESTSPDIVLLDLWLPKRSGLDVCRHIRERSRVPIIMVTAKSSETDTVVGLEVGADDYVTKPFRLSELIARMRAVMRRSGAASEGSTSDEKIVIDNLELDRSRHEVYLDGRKVSLPLKEFELLEKLMASAGRVVTRDAIIDEVWGRDYVGDTKTLDVHVKRLRAKVEADPSKPAKILTVRGVGYKFDLDQTAKTPPRDQTAAGDFTPGAEVNPSKHAGVERSAQA